MDLNGYRTGNMNVTLGYLKRLKLWNALNIATFILAIWPSL